MPTEARWLSVDEICAYLGVSRDTVYAWIAKRGMPAHRIGRLWKLKRGDVDAWVRASSAADGPEANVPEAPRRSVADRLSQARERLDSDDVAVGLELSRDVRSDEQASERPRWEAMLLEVRALFLLGRYREAATEAVWSLSARPAVREPAPITRPRPRVAPRSAALT